MYKSIILRKQLYHKDHFDNLFYAIDKIYVQQLALSQ